MSPQNDKLHLLQFKKLERILQGVAHCDCVKNKFLLPAVDYDDKLVFVDKTNDTLFEISENENIDSTVEEIIKTVEICDYTFKEGFYTGIREVLSILNKHKKILETNSKSACDIETNIECLVDYLSAIYCDRDEFTYIQTDIFLNDNEKNIDEEGKLLDESQAYIWGKFDLTAQADGIKFDESDVMNSYSAFIDSHTKK